MLSIEFLLKRFEFDLELGQIFLRSNGNRADKLHHFRSESNTRYRQVQLPSPVDNGSSWVKISAHRMIWAVANGRWPAEGMDIDHKDSDTQNNAISNLEEVLEAENIRRGRVRRKKKAEIERSKELSLFDLRSRGKEGDVKAQFELGKLYHLGTAVRKNHFEASYWYRLAAEQGHKEAKKNLEKLFF